MLKKKNVFEYNFASRIYLIAVDQIMGKRVCVVILKLNLSYTLLRTQMFT
jgi:hypothetical protein